MWGGKETVGGGETEQGREGGREGGREKETNINIQVQVTVQPSLTPHCQSSGLHGSSAFNRTVFKFLVLRPEL